MRFLTLLAFLSVFVSLFFMEGFSINSDTFYSRKLELAGNKILLAKDITAILPKKNNLWWYFSPKVLERKLEAHSLVKQASVSPCAWHKINCYQISISEEAPAYYFAQNQDSGWLVSENGTYLMPANKEYVMNLDSKYPILKDEQGLQRNQEYLISRRLYLLTTLPKIKKTVKTKIFQATLKANNNLEVEFLRNSNPDTIKYVFSNFQSSSKDKFRQEMQRFQQINAKRTKLSEDVHLIDLTSDSQAILRGQV